MGLIILIVIVWLVFHGHHTRQLRRRWHCSIGFSLLGPLGTFIRISRRIR
jgi:hypothetical protein